MKNKALKRIFKKNFEIGSDEELISYVAKLKTQFLAQELPAAYSGFFDNFLEVTEILDKTLSDYERTLEIRDRSLEISSREMTVLNDEIQRHASQQEAILTRLQSTIEILNPYRSSQAQSDDQSLENLVETVNQLVRAQLDSVKWQRTLFDEGIKICSVLNFKNLEKQLRLSIENVTGVKFKLLLFFSGSLFEGKDAIEFYQCDDQNRPINDSQLSRIKGGTQTKFISVDSPKGSGTLAIMQLIGESDENLGQIDTMMTRISPLVPSIASTLENIKLLKDEKRQQYIEAELSTARLVQQTLLPSADLEMALEDIELNAFYQSATECGGDWWNYFKTLDGKIIILVGDVTGHGTGSAMLCAVVKGYCDSFLNRPQTTVSEILKEINFVVYKMAKKTNRMMTMLAFSMDPITGESALASAGHPAPLYFQSLSQHPLDKSVMASGPLLGLSPDSESKESKFQFSYNDMLVFFTDGLTECMNKQGEVYGDYRLERLLTRQNKVTTAWELNRTIIGDIQQFCIGEPFADDITTVVVKRSPSI